MILPLVRLFSRRAWLARTARAAALVTFAPAVRPSKGRPTRRALQSMAHVDAHAALLDPAPLEALLRHAVDAATAAGARYVDARLTRTVSHAYMMTDEFVQDTEQLGVGVRVLVNGYWGFAASPYATPEAVVRLAQDAVGQAKENAKGTPRIVELGTLPAVTGRWTTPIRIDPFTIPVEEKLDYILYWKDCAQASHCGFVQEGFGQLLLFTRQERMLATSEGTLVTQTVYETSGTLGLEERSRSGIGSNGVAFDIAHLDAAARGWELVLDANIPEQIPQQLAAAKQLAAMGVKPLPVGRYTLVLDGKTMASMVDQTLGVATQLDRALGYEANASGTSFLNDPLQMVGQLPVASPLVTVIANRSAPAQLATVQWDEEGVVPEPFPLVKNGVLVDFQTTREQAAWLAPYYQQRGQPVRSHGCAAAQTALSQTMQMMPNLALQPNPTDVRLEDLVANVPHGILIEGGKVVGMDFQARNGMLVGGARREIKNGRLGRPVSGGAVLFNSTTVWPRIQAIGGPSTAAWIGIAAEAADGLAPAKGEPLQRTSYSVSAVAAIVPNQPVINPVRKA